MEDIFYKLIYDNDEVYVREEDLVSILKTKNIPNEIIRVPESEGLTMLRYEKISKLLGEK